MTDAETLHAGPPGRPRSAPGHRTTVVIIVVLVVVAALALAGYAYARSRSLIGGPTPSQSGAASPGQSSRASATPGTALALPPVFGDYRRDDESRVERPVDAGDDVATASAYYDRNGIRQVLVIGAQPVYDLEQFLLSIGLSDITTVGDGVCGVYDAVEMCAVLTDGIAVGAVGLTGQDRAALVEIAQQARAAL